jgi:hypothetical protein
MLWRTGRRVVQVVEDLAIVVNASFGRFDIGLG